MGIGCEPISKLVYMLKYTMELCTAVGIWKESSEFTQNFIK
jgi:hypothetical protein